MNNNPLLSICCITYNHEKFIRETIESVLKQKTTFEYELIIGEDNSLDNTKSICLEYAQKYPNIINLLSPEKNLGMLLNFIQTVNACKGKYIALCEGDDYWTDPLKLQKQVDFLENNADYSLCFHNALVKHEGMNENNYLFCNDGIKEITTIKDVLVKWYIPTASMVFRKDLIEPLPSWFKVIHSGDYALQLILSSKGNIWYINEVMSVYRKHIGSLSTEIAIDKIPIYKKHLKLLGYFNKYSNSKYIVNILKQKLKLRLVIIFIKLKRKFY